MPSTHEGETTLRGHVQDLNALLKRLEPDSIARDYLEKRTAEARQALKDHREALTKQG